MCLVSLRGVPTRSMHPTTAPRPGLVRRPGPAPIAGPSPRRQTDPRLPRGESDPPRRRFYSPFSPALAAATVSFAPLSRPFCRPSGLPFAAVGVVLHRIPRRVCAVLSSASLRSRWPSRRRFPGHALGLVELFVSHRSVTRPCRSLESFRRPAASLPDGSRRYPRRKRLFLASRSSVLSRPTCATLASSWPLLAIVVTLPCIRIEAPSLASCDI